MHRKGRMTCSNSSLDTRAVPDLFVPHPNLSDAINSLIIESEIEGGVYLDRLLAGETLEIETRDWTCRLEYLGIDDVWGFALYDPAIDTYTDSLLPDGHPEGDPRDALDCAVRLHLTGIADTPIEDDP